MDKEQEQKERHYILEGQLTAMFHGAAQSSPNGCIAHDVYHPEDGSSSLILGINLRDESEARAFFDGLAQLTNGRTPTWLEHQVARDIAQDAHMRAQTTVEA